MSSTARALRAEQRTVIDWRRMFVFALSFLIVIGIAFRLYHIDRKVYWDDEVYTTIRVLGLSETELVSVAQHITDSDQLRLILHPGRAALRPVRSTVESLMLEEPQHPPLYYILARLWIQLFGDSTLAIRLLSVVIGIVTLPCMFMLCRELFGTRALALLGTAALAVSPISIIYAQQAREYELWTLFTIVSCALFLRAMVTGSVRTWTLYAIAVSLSLYVFPLTGIVALGNLAYAAIVRPTAPAALRSASISTGLAFLAFVPWIVVMIENLEQIGRAMHGLFAVRLPVSEVLRQVDRLFALSYFDFGRPSGGAHTLLHVANFLSGFLAILLLGWLSILAVKIRDRRIWPYIAMLLTIEIVPLLTADMIFTGNRTGEVRYFMPLFVGIDLAIVYAFKMVNTFRETSRLMSFALLGIVAMTFFLRISSCVAISRAQTWWSSYDLQAIRVATTINRSPHSFILSDNYLVWSLVLGNYLSSGIQLQLRPTCYLCTGGGSQPFDFSKLGAQRRDADVFLLGASPSLALRVAHQLKGRPMSDHLRCIDVRHNCIGVDSLF